MLRRPSERGKLTKDKIKALVAIAVLGFVCFIVNELFLKKEKPVSTKPTLILINGQDTTMIDISGWDSIRLDSFVRAQQDEAILTGNSSHKYDDELNILDSLSNLPSSGLVDSFLLEVKRHEDLQRQEPLAPKEKNRK
jgi:hypothetical protein